MKTDKERLDYLNKELTGGYISLKTVNWQYISAYTELSEDFIRNFSDKLNWYWISRFQKLSEEFIREFKDKVDWGMISKYQKLSKEFLHEFKDMIALDVFLCREDIRNILIDKIIN